MTKILGKMKICQIYDLTKNQQKFVKDGVCILEELTKIGLEFTGDS